MAKSDAERAREYRARKKASAARASGQLGLDQALLAQVQERADSTGIPVREVVERLLTAYVDGKVNVPPRASAPSEPSDVEDEIPPEPPEFRSDFMRRKHGQG